MKPGTKEFETNFLFCRELARAGHYQHELKSLQNSSKVRIMYIVTASRGIKIFVG